MKKLMAKNAGMLACLVTALKRQATDNRGYALHIVNSYRDAGYTVRTDGGEGDEEWLIFDKDDSSKHLGNVWFDVFGVHIIAW